MTNNTINNVPRELLCELRDAANEGMNATTRQHQINHFAGLIAKADALLSAPSPANHVEGVRAMVAEPVQQVSVPDEMRSLAQRLREYNQNPHHINPMSEAFHILVADAANALSTACVPKEISAAITWSEHLLFECGALTSTRAPSVHVYNKTFAAVNEARAMLAAAPSAGSQEQGE